MGILQRLAAVERRAEDLPPSGPPVPDVPIEVLRTWPAHLLLDRLLAVLRAPCPPLCISAAEQARLAALPMDELRRLHAEALGL